MRIGSLFSGAGGLDMAVEAIFGATIAWQCEIDPAASKVLAHRWPGVPNAGDVVTHNWNAAEPVDIICGGFPCQDVSTAGRRAGLAEGTRSGLWHEMARIIGIHQPRWVVIENVKGLLSAQAHRTVERRNPAMGDGPGRPILRAIGAVLGDLSELGYDAQWVTVRASDVGAPHRRERVFLLAYAAGARLKGDLPQGASGRSGWSGLQPVDDDGLLTTPQARDWKGTNSTTGGPWQSLPRDLDELLPTPTAGAGGNTSRGGDRKGELLLGGVVQAIAANEALLPTPAACNPNDGEGAETWLARRDEVKERVRNGNGMGMPLSIAVQLLPTPNAQDSNGGKQRSQAALDAGTHQANLTDIARLLPTPSASDGIGGGPNNPENRLAQGHQVQLLDLGMATSETWGKYSAAIRRWETLTRPAPAPTELNSKGKPRLAAAFSEWMMGWPAGHVTDVPGVGRNDALRITGNGVCPQQAHAALSVLLSVPEGDG